MENETQDQNVLTEGTEADVQEETQNGVNENETPSEQPQNESQKTFTQEVVDNLIKKRLERERQATFKRYGVENRSGLDNLIGQAQSYGVMKERYAKMKEENAMLNEKIAFLTNNINPSREDDIRAYFKGKGLEFSNENLVNELASHPEWLNVVQTDDTPKTTIKALGVEHKDTRVPESEEEKLARVYGY